MPYSKRSEASIKKRKLLAIEFLGGKCVSCGSTERLQFDHIDNDREDDAHMICRMVRKNDWNVLMDELKKCQLLCISCHAIKTGADRSAKEPPHGVLSTYINRRCRCDDCRRANTSWTRQRRGVRV